GPADRIGGGGDHDHAAAAAGARQPVPQGCRRPSAGGDEPVAPTRRPGSPEPRCEGNNPVQPRGRANEDVTPDRSRVDERLDVVAAVLVALATVATEWSGYQASRWNGEQAKASGRTNAIRIDAARAQGLAQAQTQVDVATFSSWADAYAHKDTLLADFYFK